IDPDKIKDEIWQTKVIGQEIKYLPSFNESSTNSVAHSEQAMHSEGHGVSVGTKWEQGHVESKQKNAASTLTESENADISVSDGITRGKNDSTGETDQRGKQRV